VAGHWGISGYVKSKPDSAYVVFTPHNADDMVALSDKLQLDYLIFARQIIFSSALVSDLPLAHRTLPLMEAARQLGPQFGELLLETADTNEAKETLGFCRQFAPHMRKALEKAELLSPVEITEPTQVTMGSKSDLPRLHLFFLGSGAAYVGLSYPATSSPWAMGIPRLKMPREAPSRSALKLVEAIYILLTDEEREDRLKQGMKAVDLGAAPGGWSWCLAQRNLLVTAIDNGTMDKALMAGGMVDHLRVDGFHYRPNKPVDWMVCDMIESPSRIATLVGEWAANKLCRDSIFNLKLPMKKRYEEAKQCEQIISTRLKKAGVPFRIRMKQLYHDREEITVYLHCGKP